MPNAAFLPLTRDDPEWRHFGTSWSRMTDSQKRRYPSQKRRYPSLWTSADWVQHGGSDGA